MKFLESSIHLGFIQTAKSYKVLAKVKVQTFLEDPCKEWKEAITLKVLDIIVKYELRIHMKNSNATTCMQEFLDSYHTILSKNELK